MGPDIGLAHSYGDPSGSIVATTTRTDPMMPFGTGTVGGARHEPEQPLHQEGLWPTQTKPAIFDPDHIA